ncbi:UNVERIFIED_CONTAM: hypothetical protein HDU68_011446 [Siphonaria sp. JEL0065]|nr:hypothetical protein HDU68_011446 [Siphonaria sp. JEL0065]
MTSESFGLEVMVGCLAIYTGVATINGQRWIARVNYIGVDVPLEDAYLITRLALRVSADQQCGKRGWIEILIAANTMFGVLCHQIAYICGKPITALSRTTQDVADRCIESIKGSSGTDALVAALSNVKSVTISSNIHKVLSATVVWAFENVPDFEENWPEFGSLKKNDDSVFMNELEVILETTEEFRGVIFGHRFLLDMKRGITGGWYDVASKYVAEGVKIVEMHSTMSLSTNEFLRRESETTGLSKFEDWMEARIADEDAESFDFNDFCEDTKSGTGLIACTIKIQSDRVGFFATAVNFKITEIRLSYFTATSN